MVLELVLDSLLTLGAYKGTGYALDVAEKKRTFWTKKRWEQEYNDFRERVWKLEAATGVGLSNDTKEWLVGHYTTKPKAASGSPGSQKLVDEFNPYTKVRCLVCDKKFSPVEEYPEYAESKNSKPCFFGKGGDALTLRHQRACREHLELMDELVRI